MPHRDQARDQIPYSALAIGMLAEEAGFLEGVEKVEAHMANDTEFGLAAYFYI